MGGQPDEGDRLKVGAVGARGLELERLELRGDVLSGETAAPRAGGTSLEQVIGEVADMRVHRRAADRWEGRWRGSGSLPAERGHRRDERSEEHTSELQSRPHLVCRLLLEKKKK